MKEESNSKLNGENPLLIQPIRSLLPSILRNLPTDEIIRAQRVCKGFRDIIETQIPIRVYPVNISHILFFENFALHNSPIPVPLYKQLRHFDNTLQIIHKRGVLPNEALNVLEQSQQRFEINQKALHDSIKTDRRKIIIKSILALALVGLIAYQMISDAPLTITTITLMLVLLRLCCFNFTLNRRKYEEQAAKLRGDCQVATEIKTSINHIYQLLVNNPNISFKDDVLLSRRISILFVKLKEQIALHNLTAIQKREPIIEEPQEAAKLFNYRP